MSSTISNTMEKHRVGVSFKSDFFDHYYLDTKLGQGNFAQVRNVVALDAGRDAIEEGTSRKDKCAKILDLRDNRQVGKACAGLQDLAAMEVSIFQKVGHHPNVVEFYGAYVHANIGYIVMEKCHCGLFDYMKQLPDLTEKSLGKLVFQMVTALHHLHSLRVVHRDVKPDNFLVGGARAQTVKLCDFGLAAVLPEHGKLCGPVGTTPFMCPEMFVGEWYDESADIWSLAVTVYAFLFGAFPYESKDGTNEGMRRAIMKGKTPTFEPFTKKQEPRSTNACKFVKALLQRDSDNRPSAAEALNLPYIVDVTTGRHMKGVTLPSLQPCLHAARRCGVVASRDLSKRTDLDDLLSILQFKKLGMRLPQAWKSHQLPMATSLSEKAGKFGEDAGLNSIALSTISERSTACSPRQSPRKISSPTGSSSLKWAEKEVSTSCSTVDTWGTAKSRTTLSL
jgi:serine/threonine protein kinase